MNIREAIGHVVVGRDLPLQDMIAVMHEIMSGAATPAQIGGLLVALRMKGETVDEITGAATVMRELSMKVDVPITPLVDTCGTGGDGARTLNVSTAAAFVAAAGGAYVAKHGNRSASSSSGSADLLEAAGARLALPPKAIASSIAEIGIGFMFAPAHHGATRHAAGPRRELGVRTMFNLLGPLTNPAGAKRQLVGVFGREWVAKTAEVLGRLGLERALVVHSDDGLDEFSIAAPTCIAELAGGTVRNHSFDPASLGIVPPAPGALEVRDAAQSLERINAVFADTPGPARDIVALNAGAVLYLCDKVEDFAEGYRRALEIIASGAAAACFRSFIERTQRAEE